MAQLDFLSLGSGYMPHGMCYLWQPALVGLHAGSDSVIGLSYVAIAVMIGWLGYRAREELPFRAVFAAFGLFIVACGMTHLLEVYTLWHPIYWVSGGVKAVTAAASLATALALPEVVPEILTTIRDARVAREQRTELERTVAELRESQSRFREMFEHAPIGMGLVGLDGRWLQVNRALCEIVGYTVSELLAIDFQRVTHPEDLLADEAQAERLAAGEIESYQMEKRYVRKDGTAVWVLLSGSAVRAADGSTLYFIAQVVDITTRRVAAEQELELARAQAAREAAESAAARMEYLARVSSVLVSSLEQAPALQAVATLSVPVLGEYCALDVLAEGGTLQRVAVAQADATRPPSAGVTSWLPPVDAPVIAEAMRSGEAVVLEPGDEGAARHAGDAGSRGEEAVSRSGVVVPLVAAGQAVGALTLVRRARDGRGERLADLPLAEEVARRAAVAVQNAHLYQRAEAANRAKSDFLTVMSHELRTPLNAVVGYTDLLQAGVPGPLTSDQALYLDRIRRSAAHLLSLIEEVLTYARLEAGRETVRRDAVELDDLVRQASALVEPTAAARGLRYEVYVPEQDIHLETDARKVRQMLANLLSNAVKFTEEGSVVLTVRDAGDEVLFEVRDTGIGIAPEHLDRIFDAFWQAESGTTRRAQGTGLGLGVTHRLARLLGGDVTVQSEPGQGSTFTLRLPKRAPTAA